MHSTITKGGFMYLLNEFFLNLEIFSSSKLFVWLNFFFFFDITLGLAFIVLIRPWV